MTEPCIQEANIAVMKEGAERREKKLDRVLDILEGNGEPGLKTKVAIHRTYFKLIAAIGGPVLVFLTARAIWAWIGQ